MLYELVAVVRPGKLSEIKEIAKTAGSIVLSRQGVLRGFSNWGTFLLPKPMQKHQVKYHTGHYFLMRFDSSAITQHAIKKTLSLDPRLLRYSIVKLGCTLEEVKNIEGVTDWITQEK